MNDSPLLQVTSLKKHFPVRSKNPLGGNDQYVKAVDGIDFTLEKGKTLALVGESGCGKTTTARLVLRLETPTAGEVLVRGKDVHRLSGTDLKRYRRQVQAVFQDPWASLNPRMRVKDLVAEPLVVTGNFSRKEVTKRVEKVLEDVGLLPPQGRNFPHEFSGGQRQRIAVASALVSEPELIVLDEPVSALDVSIRSQIMNMLKDIQQEYGVSYLLVAHDLGTTRYMADEVAVIYLGRVVEHGPTEAIFESHAHPYTEALLSAALPGHPDLHQEEIVLRGEVPSPVNPPGGCPFHTRCHRMFGSRCELEAPKLQAVDQEKPDHVASCHLLNE